MSNTIQKNYSRDVPEPTHWQIDYLVKHIQLGKTKSQAAKLLKVSPDVVYKWIIRYPAIRARVAEAEKVAIDPLEQSARSRAVDGYDIEKKIYDGEGNLKSVEVVHQYDNKLLHALLKAGDPARFGNNSQQNITVQHNVDLGQALRDARVRASLPPGDEPIDVKAGVVESEAATTGEVVEVEGEPGNEI